MKENSPPHPLFVGLDIESSALHMLVKCSTTELQPQPQERLFLVKELNKGYREFMSLVV